VNIFTEIKEGLFIAWEAIVANKMRAALTTLGIIVGIVSVTLMGAAIDGLNRSFHESVSMMGADVLFAGRMSWFINSMDDWIKQSKRRVITYDQVKAVEKQLTLAGAVAPVVQTTLSVRYNNRNADGVMVFGTTEQFQATGGLDVAQGRFLSVGDAAGGRPVCVIGNDVATNLFGRESPLGKRIRVGSIWLEVVGVLEKRGSFMGMASMDEQAIVPIQQFLIGYGRNPDFQIHVKARDLTRLEDAKEELRSALRKVRHIAPGEPDDFAIGQQEQVIQMFNRLAGTIAAVGLAVTGLSLFVGGIGIMNIMFVSVAERTREIGVRKAIGARRRTILLQFLMEAAGICLLGGLTGLGIAYGLTLLMSKFFPASLSLPVTVLALGVSLLTGVVSGFLPAWRAARMDPVEALRNE
jgi:putative ABC transport system permease protein